MPDLNVKKVAKHTTFSVIFMPRVVKNKKKEKLYARITVNGERVETSLGRNISEGLFKPKEQRCSVDKAEGKQVNDSLSIVYGELHEIRKELILEGKTVTAGLIKTRYKGLPDPDDIPDPTLLELYDEHNQKFKELIGTKNHSQETYKRHKVSLKHAHDFIEEVIRKDD